MAVDIVTRCSVCGSTELRRYGLKVDPNDNIATEFAECQGCGTKYLYKRPAPPSEPSDAPRP